MSDVHDATEELHAANDGLGWFVGPPGQCHGGSRAISAFNQTEKAHIGRRSREWTAVDETGEECIREMARCLREIGAGRVPE